MDVGMNIVCCGAYCIGIQVWRLQIFFTSIFSFPKSRLQSYSGCLVIKYVWINIRLCYSSVFCVVSSLVFIFITTFLKIDVIGYIWEGIVFCDLWCGDEYMVLGLLLTNNFQLKIFLIRISPKNIWISYKRCARCLDLVCVNGYRVL